MVSALAAADTDNSAANAGKRRDSFIFRFPPEFAGIVALRCDGSQSKSGFLQLTLWRAPVTPSHNQWSGFDVPYLRGQRSRKRTSNPKLHWDQ
jgi:hypothetical protein